VKRGSVLVLASNTSWSIANFRTSLIREMSQAGFSVVVVAPRDKYSEDLGKHGCRYEPLPMDNKGRNPFRDALLFGRFLVFFARERPSCFLSFTIKPNIYGSIAANLLGIPVVNNIAGLGSVFVSKGLTQTVVRIMYRIALRHSRQVFFQNSDDYKIFIDHRITRPEISEILPGSGVDTVRFAPRPRQITEERFTFLFLGRLLREKGVPEFVEAARALSSNHPNTRFQILGFSGVDNPSAIQASELQKWADEGIIENLGETDDVRPFLANADCIVLPSYYREGVPRTLLEAASMERPVITTDMPGCRDAVIDGKSGFIVKPQNVAELVGKMKIMMDLPAHSREQMGKYAREHVQTNFDERRVLSRYLTVIGEIASGNRG
jgi:glycosyltransferase involved in cell wall biosynthesis